ncbi:MAG: hypothetical protein WBB82_00405 [Limnothrix sp.]
MYFLYSNHSQIDGFGRRSPVSNKLAPINMGFSATIFMYVNFMAIAHSFIL